MLDSETSASSPAILVEGLYKTYPGKIEAVRGVDLSVADGEMLAIMGKSGSGKSTLLNLIGTLDRPDKGRIKIHGQDTSSISNLARFRREEIGFVFQLHYLLPHLSLLENVALPIQGKPDAQMLATEALEQVGLGHRIRHVPTKVSGGERQRAAIARAIVNRPRVLLADEPTGNVDSEIESTLLDLFQALQSELGMTLIVVTHEPTVAERANRIVHYKDGKIEEIAPNPENAVLKDVK
ncbi:MAG: ABC transporter ATP-binding protein [Planctomycetes bacterium]|nr:ABC transporter ATP-binding protein [Planctomycetota bacterium]MCA8945663.1 ABC transporter ATP-binding protein [Planctomycetota bacterium]